MSKLWVPGMESDRTPRFACANCDDHPEFDSRSQYVRHVARCVKVNEPIPPPRNAFNSYNDAELVAFVKKANREGRQLRGIVGSKGTLTPRKKKQPKVEEDSPNA